MNKEEAFLCCMILSCASDGNFEKVEASTLLTISSRFPIFKKLSKTVSLIIEEVKVICKLPKGVFPIAGLALGWPDQKSNVSIRLSQDIVIHFDKYDEKDLIQKINKYDEIVFKKDPIPENKQRHVDLYGVAKKGTWSENISRQLSVPERSNFKNWLKENGFNLE